MYVRKPDLFPQSIEQLPVSRWLAPLKNPLSPHAHPIIRIMLNLLYDGGQLTASILALYAIFQTGKSIMLNDGTLFEPGLRAAITAIALVAFCRMIRRYVVS